jgi:hypothetical protein
MVQYARAFLFLPERLGWHGGAICFRGFQVSALRITVSLSARLLAETAIQRPGRGTFILAGMPDSVLSAAELANRETPLIWFVARRGAFSDTSG